MIPLTEADLLKMREVQEAMILPGGVCQGVEIEPGIYSGCACDCPTCNQARAGWPRVTEWAVKALGALRNRVRQGHHEFCLSRKFSLCHCGYAEARRLLGE